MYRAIMQANNMPSRCGMRLVVALVVGLSSTGAIARQPVFAALYAGGTVFDTDYQYAGTLPSSLDDDGDSVGLGVGYEVTQHWFLQLDYIHSDAGDVDIDQVFLSLNYQMPLFIKGMRGVVGVVAGEGRLDWNSPPGFADARFDDLDDDESLYGIKLELNYDLSEHWSTSLSYQYFSQEFNTNIDVATGIDIGGAEVTTRAEFEHKEHQYVLFGIRYHL
ncbi:MAG: hypothetical protein ABJ308_11655 [Halieaceae bacterium]